MRVKRGVKARRRRNRTLALAKGFRGRSKNTIRQATQRVEKAMVYAYRDRRANKRHFRELWIVRISVAAKELGISYSKLINGLKLANIDLDRKMLADLVVRQPEAFQAVVETAKAAIA
ncbi:MAG: 50S ribosomal protein L20 [Bdellovibrionota bacterium]